MVVDDHPFIRAIVKLTLEKGNFVVVAEAATGIDAIKQAKRLKPDLMTLDISMPELDGLEVLHRLAELPKTLVLSSMTEDYYALRCLRAGAMGYLSKMNNVEILLVAANAIMDGYTFFPNVIMDRQGLMPHGSAKVVDAELISKLSPRELSILIKISRGKTVTEIAQDLMLSSKTISTYKSRLSHKLSLNSVIHFFEFAKRNNL